MTACGQVLLSFKENENETRPCEIAHLKILNVVKL